MTPLREVACPGCGLRMPASDNASYDGYFNTSGECWSVFTEVLGAEYNDPFIFGKAHQLTVDTYAIQHAGGGHPDKSITIHVSGLYLVLERGLPPTQVPRRLKRIADTVREWPHYPPPGAPTALTVCDVALADSAEEHVTRVREWASLVWDAWSPYHGGVAEFVRKHTDLD